MESAQRPEEIHRLFERFVNEANIDGLVSLFETDATLVAQPGEVVSGEDAIRTSLGGILQMNPHMDVKTQHVLEAGELAFLSNHWQLSAKDPEGNDVQMQATTAEVVRRQEDGSWRFVIDDPYFHQ